MTNGSKNTDRRSLGLGASQRHQNALRLQDSMAVKVDGLVKIPLTRGKWTTMDEADWQLVKMHKWFAQKNKHTFYARSSTHIDGKPVFASMHRLILKAQPLQIVDHKDGDGLNNIRTNLRICTNAQNTTNSRMRSSNTTGYRGVGIYKKCFAAYIWINGKQRFIGSFKTAQEAALAYNKAAEKHYGEFAQYNKL